VLAVFPLDCIRRLLPACSLHSFLAGKGWNHWTLYYGYSNRPTNPNSLLVQLGFAKVRKPDAQGDFSEKTGVILFYVIAAILLIIGIGGVVVIVHQSIN
jgi:hypothetical protein